MSGDRKNDSALPSASQWIRTIQRYQSDHPELVRVLDVVARLQDRPYRTEALLLGEHGTGKEGLARALHALMHSSEAPFVETSLGGRDPREAATELFGNTGGPGVVERAHGGTIYIDEITTLSRELQARLIGVLRGKTRREGETSERAVSVNIIAAAEEQLVSEVATGRFRHDLYWRLARLVLTLPPLRERRNEVSRLAVWIGSRIFQKHGFDRRLALEADADSDAVILSSDAAAALNDYDWPGNMRELDAVLERALLLYGNEREIQREHIAAAIAHGLKPKPRNNGSA
jgi:DNA-binding NtrC family response regulator